MDLENIMSLEDDDDDDIEEFTEEEKANDPSKRILWGAENNLLDIVQDVLSSDPSLVSSCDADLYTPLHRASYNNHPEMAKLLIGHGADISARTADGWQPLHSAARWNSFHTAQVLLGSGADINAQTHGGLTPLHVAASEPQNGEMLELLLRSPFVDVSIVSRAGETARQLCERHSPHYKLFDMLDDSVCRLKPAHS
ncbi:ankyrin repeat domain-containing protein 49 isoform X2 [Aplysia californica]|nr:ankyrin repeat domain-containing protein 49 isoform X2 [Aplysia californica]